MGGLASLLLIGLIWYLMMRLGFGYMVHGDDRRERDDHGGHGTQTGGRGGQP